jgi:hypothetical protein
MFNNGSGPHPDVVFSYDCTGTIWRYNVISNSMGDGFMYGGNTGPDYFYGNVFVNWNQYLWYESTSYSYGANQIFFWNNTIGSYSGFSAYGGFFGGGGHAMGSGSQVYNNIFDISATYGGQGSPGDPGGATWDYNYYVTGTSSDGGSHSVTGARPFVGGTTGTDFHLNIGSGPINHGVALSTNGYINVDTDGDIRGADGAWDIGAYEYVVAGASGQLMVWLNSTNLVPANSYPFGSSPTNLTTAQPLFTVKNTSTGTLNGTCSVAAPFSITSGGTYNLAQNGTQSVTVSFKPTAINSYTQMITFSAVGNTSTNFILSGRGTATTIPGGPQLPVINPNP